MNEHFLIANAVRSQYRQSSPIPVGVTYDAKRGYWIRDGQPWVLTDGAQPLTKKADIETGEDEKGE